MRLQDNKKGCRVKKNYSLMLYQRVMGDFYPINSEGKFTLSLGDKYLWGVRYHVIIISGEEIYSSN